jgi:hypothetical protein
MKPGLVHSIVGLLSGFVLSMFFLALVITWPIRTLGLAIILVFAFVVIMRRDDKPLQRWHFIAGWFILGCGLAAALLAILELVFPPLT